VDDIQKVEDIGALMGAAKVYADLHLIKIVLIVSSGKVARQMLDHSAKSRAKVCRLK
jgi:hypothetical protein